MARTRRGTSSSGRSLAAVAAGMALVTLVAFGSALPKTFVNFDDNVYVTENPHVRAGLGTDGVAWAFTTTTASNWHPVTWLSHMADVQLFGLDAARHHLVNLLLHAANVALLFLLLATMTGAVWRSAFAAALFALHPLHVESFAWVAAVRRRSARRRCASSPSTSPSSDATAAEAAVRSFPPLGSLMSIRASAICACG